MKTTNINCKTAREIDIVDYLAQQGHQPAKIRGQQYWYLSPLRNENNPSFKVNRKLNRWIDFGDGSKGDLVDLGTKMRNCSVEQLLGELTNSSFLKSAPFIPFINMTVGELDAEKDSAIKIIRATTIHSVDLEKYLLSRRITLDIAKRFCREIEYEVRGKRYRAIGFKNGKGGYELRSPYFKGSSTPKGYTHMNTASDKLSVFEGFMDMLAFNSACSDLIRNSSVLILNSLSFFNGENPVFEQYKSVELYLDNDSAGQKITQQAIAISDKFIDKSDLYKGYKDVNDWTMNIGKGENAKVKVSQR